jgi:hypothetical protein
MIELPLLSNVFSGLICEVLIGVVYHADKHGGAS